MNNLFNNSFTTDPNKSIKLSQYNKSEHDRLVGINNFRFIVHHNMNIHRRNIIYKSKQFETIMADSQILEKYDPFTLNEKMYELFYSVLDSLTDVTVDIDGYY